VTRSTHNWNGTPGAFDTVNTFFIPSLTANGMPVISAQEMQSPARLIRYGIRIARIKADECIHFFLDDYRFENVWRYPRRVAASLQGHIVLSPDFSLYSDWPLPVQMWNTYRSPCFGAYWQSLGVTGVPTVSWSTRESYAFCFDGIEKGAMVAISSIGAGKSNPLFIRGFDAMIEHINPSLVICYGDFDTAYGESCERVKEYPYLFVRQESRLLLTADKLAD